MNNNNNYNKNDSNNYFASRNSKLNDKSSQFMNEASTPSNNSEYFSVKSQLDLDDSTDLYHSFGDKLNKLESEYEEKYEYYYYKRSESFRRRKKDSNKCKEKLVQNNNQFMKKAESCNNITKEECKNEKADLKRHNSDETVVESTIYKTEAKCDDLNNILERLITSKEKDAESVDEGINVITINDCENSASRSSLKKNTTVGESNSISSINNTDKITNNTCGDLSDINDVYYESLSRDSNSVNNNKYGSHENIKQLPVDNYLYSSKRNVKYSKDLIEDKIKMENLENSRQRSVSPSVEVFIEYKPVEIKVDDNDDDDDDDKMTPKDDVDNISITSKQRQRENISVRDYALNRSCRSTKEDDDRKINLDNISLHSGASGEQRRTMNENISKTQHINQFQPPIMPEPIISKEEVNVENIRNSEKEIRMPLSLQKPIVIIGGYSDEECLECKNSLSNINNNINNNNNNNNNSREQTPIKTPVDIDSPAKSKKLCCSGRKKSRSGRPPLPNSSPSQGNITIKKSRSPSLGKMKNLLSFNKKHHEANGDINNNKVEEHIEEKKQKNLFSRFKRTKSSSGSSNNNNNNNNNHDSSFCSNKSGYALVQANERGTIEIEPSGLVGSSSTINIPYIDAESAETDKLIRRNQRVPLAQHDHYSEL